MIDFNNLEQYKENNRLEVKKPKAACLIAFGKHILLSQIP